MNNPGAPITGKILDEVVDAILVGMQGMFDKMNAKIDARFELMETRLDSTDRRVDNLTSKVAGLETRFGKMEAKLETLTTDVKSVKRQVNKLQSNTPTREEVDALKAKVYQRSPIM